MTATDFLLAREMLDADVASRSLGIELLELSAGGARASMTVTPEMANGYSITHGGYVFMLADTTFALACNSYDEPAVAARADIRYLRSTTVGDVLIAEAVERARYGRNGIYDVTVTRDGDVVAEFRGDSRTLSRR